MRTVKEVSRLTGVSIRALHHYDAIGLLPPTEVTAAGYRLYDDAALERLQLILFFRALRFPLRQIGAILDAPDFDRNRALEQQIGLLELQKTQIENLLSYARGTLTMGVSNLDFSAFDTTKLDDYTAQAKALWGKSDAYKEFEAKAGGRSQQEEQTLAGGLMDLFRRFGALRDQSPDSCEVQALVGELQSYLTAHYYTCTPKILLGLGEMYAGCGSMTENIDRAGGPGTGTFVRQAIQIYCKK